MNHKLRHTLHIAGSKGADLMVGTLALLCALAKRFVSALNHQPDWLAGCSGSRSTRRPHFVARLRAGHGMRRTVLGLFFLLSLSLSLAPVLSAATPPGTTIPNTASVEYEVSGSPQPPEPSNTVSFTIREQAVIQFMKYSTDPSIATDINVPPTFYRDGSGTYQPLPSGALPPSHSNPVPLTVASNYRVGEPFYILLTDRDQNLDPAVAESIVVSITSSTTGDTEWLRLTETGPGTGQFAGYIPSTSADNGSSSGDLTVDINSNIVATYTDPLDATPTIVDLALVDPYGVIFDSITGQPVNGATVTLIDDNTGNPANVLGDDLFPGFPATVTSGEELLHNGNIYTVPPGGFRFPYVLPGDYRLEITPPEGYSNHTTTADFPTLTVLPGGPYTLSDASLGAPFVVNPGPAIHIDVPVDPAPTELWLQKTVNYDTATVGDFLQYKLTLENLSSATTATDVKIDDRLPLGFRYQQGSVRVNTTRTGNPEISRDGRELLFELGDIPAGQSVIVTYVVEVAAGAEQGDAINRASAQDASGLKSNTAAATVEVLPLFFDDSVFLAGRVLSGSCDQDDTEMEGVPGVRIYLEDGSYIVTDDHGRYHFEGVEPGVHVVQVDTPSLPAGYEMLPCEESSQFAGRTFSSFVDLKGGTLWRVNFYSAPKAPATGEVAMQMIAELEGDVATFHIDLNAEEVTVDNLRLTVMLPGNSSYIGDTLARDDTALEAPEVMPGVVTIRTAGLSAGESARISFRAKLDSSAASGSLPAKAMLIFDSPSAENQQTSLVETSFILDEDIITESNEVKIYPHYPSFVAELQATDKAMLKQLVADLDGQKVERIDVVGHTDNQQVSPRSRHIFADNQVLALARAKGVTDFLRQHLDIPEDALTVRGLGDSMPVADNNSDSGRALNRRVELYLVTEKEARSTVVTLENATSEKETVTTTGQSLAKKLTQRSVERPSVVLAEPPVINDNWLLEASPEVELVWPQPGYAPEFPSLKVLLKHKRGHRPSLSLNGAEVSAVNLDTTHTHPYSQTNVTAWFGLDLKAGYNLLEATVSGPAGELVDKVSREVWYVSAPDNVELLPDRSSLLADGLTPPVLAVRLTDAEGHPIRQGQVGEYTVQAPYQALVGEKQHDDQSDSLGSGMHHYTVGVDGVALLYLEPTTQAGEVQILVPLSDRTEELYSWLKPTPREWILVGFAEGTVGYNTFSGNQASLAEADIDEHFYDDGEVKFFAKGAIKGEWLLTMAYDSDKPNRDGDSLHQFIDPDTYYPLYGDGTNQGYEASSARELYLKLEREQFYALFGDMTTGLTQTELSRYSRDMNGFKSEMQTDKFSYTMFAADTRQSFEKDEIRGDGTSGRYYLSASDLVINSERVTIETRDRFHSERVLETRNLARHTDYDIDYNAGSLYFKQPVPSKDGDFNPVFIVARYETRDSSDKNFNYGGRVATRVLDKKVELGASYIHEERGAGEGDLYGVDATVRLTPKTTLHVEAATTDTEIYDDDESGDAYLAELRHAGNRVQSLAYYREQDEAFGLGQQNNSETGTRKYGVEGSYHFTPQISASGLAYHEDVLSSGAERDVAEVDARYQSGRYGVYSGLREARDQFKSGEKLSSTQWLLGGDWVTPDRKLRLRTDYEQSLGSDNENSDFPTLLTLGADYQLSSRVSMFAEQEFSWGDQQDTEGTRAGFMATPWQGGEMRTTLEQQRNENGQRVNAIFGLGQSWQVNQNWSVDAMLDRSYLIKGSGNERFNSNVPSAHGSDEDFTSVSAGATYRKARWTWWNRLETRQGDNEDKYGASSSIVGEPKPGVAVSAKALAFITDVSDGIRRTDGNIRMGLAYRPAASRWLVLNRLDFYFDKEDHSSTEYDNWRIINNLHANFRLSRKLQMSFYYGLKYVRDNYDGNTYSGYTDLASFEARYNINKRWDIGVHGSVLHSWNSDTFKYSAGADVGYSPMTNTWLSLGYNVVGFEDDDFSSATYTAKGAYMRFRAKFDQQSVKDAAQWLNK